MIIVCGPKGGSKTQNGRFPSKVALHLKKVCYKVSLCESCHCQSCKAFIGLTVMLRICLGFVFFSQNSESAIQHLPQNEIRMEIIDVDAKQQTWERKLFAEREQNGDKSCFCNRMKIKADLIVRTKMLLLQMCCS